MNHPENDVPDDYQDDDEGYLSKEDQEKIDAAVPRSNTGECPICKKKGCEVHLAGIMPMPPLTDEQRAKLKDFVEALNKIVVPKDIADELKNGLKSSMVVNTGKMNTFTKVDPTDDVPPGEEDDEEEEADEEPLNEDAEEEADPPILEQGAWELPKTQQVAGGAGKKLKHTISFTGIEFLYSDYPAKIPFSKGVQSSWFDQVGIEKIHATDGSEQQFYVFRPHKNAKRMKDAMDVAKYVAPALKRRMVLALEAAAKVAKDREKTSGKVDVGRVAQLVTGARNVFFKKTDGKKLNSAISILMDNSGSMQGAPTQTSIMRTGLAADPKGLLTTRNGTSLVTVLALGEVCDDLGIAFEVMSYQNGMGECHARSCLIYKGFNEDWNATKERLGNYFCGGVDMPFEGISYALSRLMTRPEPRKVLFFLSDADDSNEGVAEIYDLAALAERKAKIKTVGIGIQTECMEKHLKERSETIMSTADLTDVVFTRMAKIIHPY